MSAAAPRLQKERIRLLLRQGFIIAAGHFFHWCNGKQDNHLPPRNSFFNNNDSLFSCYKTFIAIGKLNVLYVKYSWLDGTVLKLCPSNSPLYDAVLHICHSKHPCMLYITDQAIRVYFFMIFLINVWILEAFDGIYYADETAGKIDML